jgi:plastocyanin/putative transposon-encoded protein
MVLACLALTLLPASPAHADMDVFIVDGTCGKHCFDPETVFTNVGVPVKWTSFSIEAHDILRCSLGPCPFNGGTGADSSFVGSPELQPGETFSHNFSAPGTYNYYCEIHGYAIMHGTVTVTGEPAPADPPVGDFDGDGRTDVGVFRPSGGAWFVDGSAGTDQTTGFGTSGDLPVPADYDGDGDIDVAVFRPSSGVWFVQGGPTVAFGTSGDIPVPADYDGDGDADVAVFRPSSGVWFIQGGPAAAWGTSGDIPVPGDYDGDGDTDVAVFRPSSGTWFVQGGPTLAWGTSGDVPVPNDYDGDGDTDMAVFRPSSGVWFVNGGGATAWGTSGDIALPLPAAVRLAFFP